MHTLRQVRWGVRRGQRWLGQRFNPSALILMYHRVAELPTDPQLLGVSPKHFAEHLEVLRRSARTLSLTELARSVQQGSMPERGVVVTFDDGYADNLLAAKPLLEQRDIPATIFITAGRLDSQHEFWWDELDRLMLQPGTLPATLKLTVGESEQRWDLNGAAEYDTSIFERHRDWDLERSDDPTDRQRVYRSVYHTLRALSMEARENALDQLRLWANDRGTARTSHRTLTVDELRQLGKDHLIEIGAHTLNHPPLARLSAAAQQWEIEQSRVRLEEVLGEPVTSFAYPFGSATRETVGLVRQAGFQAACSSRPDVVWSSTNLLALPRVVVRDADGDAFARTLRYWFNG
jgi:peptidoglycan/xylan/chitin deacetylase (PgdA/CDA1 family)